MQNSSIPLSRDVKVNEKLFEKLVVSPEKIIVQLRFGSGWRDVSRYYSFLTALYW